MANEPDLQPGQESPWVLYLQKKLNYRYQQIVVPENSRYLQETIDVVQHFRRQNGLPPGSGVDAEFWAKLEGTSTSTGLTGAAGTTGAAGVAGAAAGTAGTAGAAQHAAAQQQTGNRAMDELTAFYSQLDEVNKDTVDVLARFGRLNAQALVQARVISNADQQVAAALQGRGMGGLIAAYQQQQGQQSAQA